MSKKVVSNWKKALDTTKAIFEYFLGALNGFRKWSIMILLMTFGIIFLISGHLRGNEFVDLLRFTAVAFFSFNGIEHLGKAVVAWLDKRKKK